MKIFDPVKLFEDIATLKSYKFLYGSKPMLNWQMTQETLTTGATYFGVLPIVERIDTIEGQPDTSLYETKMYVGRKFDPGESTYSTLDETHRQKYDRRLLSLTADLKDILHELFCHDSNIEITTARIVHDMNLFDENTDALMCDLSFRVDYQYTNSEVDPEPVPDPEPIPGD